MDFGGLVTRGGTGWKKTYSIQAQFRAEQIAKVLRFTESADCRMAALVRHFGDEEDASRGCGKCDVCDPAGAELRQFRRATPAEREMVQRIMDELRPVDYRAAGTLQRSLEATLSRDEFDALLNAMVRAGLIEIEDAEFEKDGETIRFRKVRLTEAGLEVRRTTPLALLISDGIVGALRQSSRTRRRARQKSSGEEDRDEAGERLQDVELSTADEALAAKLREWRAAEAKRLAGSSVCGDARSNAERSGDRAPGEPTTTAWKWTAWARPRWRSSVRRFCRFAAASDAGLQSAAFGSQRLNDRNVL